MVALYPICVGVWPIDFKVVTTAKLDIEKLAVVFFMHFKLGL